MHASPISVLYAAPGPLSLTISPLTVIHLSLSPCINRIIMKIQQKVLLSDANERYQ